MDDVSVARVRNMLDIAAFYGINTRSQKVFRKTILSTLAHHNQELNSLAALQTRNYLKVFKRDGLGRGQTQKSFNAAVV